MNVVAPNVVNQCFNGYEHTSPASLDLTVGLFAVGWTVRIGLTVKIGSTVGIELSVLCRNRADCLG